MADIDGACAADMHEGSCGAWISWMVAGSRQEALAFNFDDSEFGL